MPRVLLIRPLCEGDEPEFAEPLGLERLAGYIRDHGIADVHVFDRRLYEQEQSRGMGHSSFWHDIRALCAQDNPTHVGLSLMTSTDMPDCLRMISRLRAYYPHAAFCVGGVLATTSPTEVRHRLPRDVALVRGEGEQWLLRWVCDKAGQVDALLPNDWSAAWRPHLTRYATLGCAVNLQTSRGCPGSCTFCATPQLPEPYRRWQARDVRLVVNEIAFEAARLQAEGLLPIFNFVDDDFGPLSRVEELAAELMRQEQRISFALEMRMAALTHVPHLATRLEALHEAGLTRVFVGIESLNPHTLRAWHKPYDVSRLPQVVDAFKQARIALQPGYILWHAGQTIEGAKAEVRALWELGIYSHRMALSRLIAFPGCALMPGAADLGNVEPFYAELARRGAELMQGWTAAAIEEPRAAAIAHLTGDDTRLRMIRKTLDAINERSYQLFM